MEQSFPWSRSNPRLIALPHRIILTSLTWSERISLWISRPVHIHLGLHHIEDTKLKTHAIPNKLKPINVFVKPAV